jgi:glycosyltransferase involved in cell wall biosynthesis
MTRPLVSVVVPVYNRAALLPRTLDSVLAQTYDHFECIVADNASTDGSVRVAEAYAREDPRIRVVRSPLNDGPVANWLRGTLATRGELVKLLFSDDWMDPECLACAVDAFGEDPGLGFAYFAIAAADEPPHAGPADSRCERGLSYIWRSIVTHGRVPASPSAGVFRREDVLRGLDRSIDVDNVDLRATGIGYDQAIYFYAADRYARIRRFAVPRVHFGAGEDSISILMGRTRPGELMRAYLEAQLRFIENSRRGRAFRLVLRAAARWHLLELPLRAWMTRSPLHRARKVA